MFELFVLCSSNSNFQHFTQHKNTSFTPTVGKCSTQNSVWLGSSVYISGYLGLNRCTQRGSETFLCLIRINYIWFTYIATVHVICCISDKQPFDSTALCLLSVWYQSGALKLTDADFTHNAFLTPIWPNCHIIIKQERGKHCETIADLKAHNASQATGLHNMYLWNGVEQIQWGPHFT